MTTAAQKRNVAGGFTLVELAVVMIIIGLVVGGILKSYSMIELARLKSTVRDTQVFTAAQRAFYEKYRALPGDMADARRRLADCTAASFCADGNGDRVLGTPADSQTDLSGTPGVQENIQYWKHLVLADMIGSLDADADSDPARSEYGVTHPRAQTGGGWNAMTTPPAAAGEYGGTGIVYQLTAAPNANGAAVTPKEARHMDALLDDGRPNTGRVTAEYSATGCENDVDNSYDITVEAPVCVVYFAVQ